MLEIMGKKIFTILGFKIVVHTCTSFTLQLRIEDTGTPELQLTCVSCIANKHYMVCPSKVTAIRGTCLKNCDTITSYKHSVTTASGVAVNIDSTQTSTQLDKANLVLKGKITHVDHFITLTYSAVLFHQLPLILTALSHVA